MKMKEFTAAADRTRMKDRARQMAQLVLVDEYSISAAARLCKVSPQAVHRAVKRVMDAAAPPGHTWITVCLPTEAAKAVKKQSEQVLTTGELC